MKSLKNLFTFNSMFNVYNITLVDVLIANNSAFNLLYTNTMNLNLSHSYFYNNSFVSFLYITSSLLVSNNCVFQSTPFQINQWFISGSFSNLTIQNTEFNCELFTNGMSFKKSYLNITFSVFKKCGGSLNVESYSNLIISNSNFEENNARAIYLKESMKVFNILLINEDYKLLKY